MMISSNLNLQNSFSNCKGFPKGGEHEISAVVSKEGIIRGAYSLHPPQSETWRYASPTRIYRALCIDYNMPILTKNLFSIILNKNFALKSSKLVFNEKASLSLNFSN